MRENKATDTERLTSHCEINSAFQTYKSNKKNFSQLNDNILPFESLHNSIITIYLFIMYSTHLRNENPDSRVSGLTGSSKILLCVKYSERDVHIL